MFQLADVIDLDSLTLRFDEKAKCPYSINLENFPEGMYLGRMISRGEIRPQVGRSLTTLTRFWVF